MKALCAVHLIPSTLAPAPDAPKQVRDFKLEGQ